MVPAAPVFAIKVVVSEFIAEVPFDACTACHEVAPQVFVPDFIVPVVVRVGHYAGVGRADLIQADEPLPVGRGGACGPLYRLGMRIVSLQRWPAKIFVSYTR